MSMEELLEKVARELDVSPLNRREVLQRRLLPLLEAGQACQDNLEYHDGRYAETHGCLACKAYLAWNAALKNAEGA